MAYSKTTWQNNVTDIDENKLNKIEQGIYDNSLVVDAVTNTLNPTDTTTYKTAELTEGQITDVIGVNDIIIKGQTEQDGTPTPSAPVDVNVVSGSNVVNTSSKNLLKIGGTSQTINGITFTQNNDGSITAGGTATADTTYISNELQQINEGVRYTLTGCPSGGSMSTYRLALRCLAENGATYTVTISNTGGSSNVTPPSGSKYMRGEIWVYNGQTINKTFYPQLELGSTATTYEPHQGKELPLDLPVENLLNISNDINTTTSGITVSLINTDTIDFNGVASNTYISTGTVNLAKSLESGKTYYFKVFENNASNLRFRILGYDSNNELKFNVINGNSLTLNANIVKYRLILEGLTTNNKYNVQAKFQVSEAPYINTYTPYGTQPIELCKIGDYQDYFYKSGSKWYLHKEVEKVVLDGTETWNRNSNGAFYPANNLLLNIILPNNSSSLPLLLSDKFIASIYTDVWDNNKNFGIALASNGSNNPRIGNNAIDNVNDFKTWLANNLPSIYCAKSISTDTEITDTTLISQLEAIYNAPLYEQTNITQENNDLPMVLDITACKDNINGIKAFIRK